MWQGWVAGGGAAWHLQCHCLDKESRAGLREDVAARADLCLLLLSA